MFLDLNPNFRPFLTPKLSSFFRYELVEAAAGAPILYDGILEQAGLVGPEVVRRLMSDAKELGLDFIRFNAFSVTPK